MKAFTFVAITSVRYIMTILVYDLFFPSVRFFSVLFGFVFIQKGRFADQVLLKCSIVIFVHFNMNSYM